MHQAIAFGIPARIMQSAQEGKHDAKSAFLHVFTVLLADVGPSHGQQAGHTYPSRQVRMVVPYPRRAGPI